MVTIANQSQQNDGISQQQFSWFTIFQPSYEIETKQMNLRCLGCRELVKPDYKKPAHILGVIEFDGVYIPVIDPSILLLSKPTPLNNLSCILITPHRWQYQQYYTGIVIKDIDEIMDFTSIQADIEPLRDMSVNMKFVRDIRKSPGAESWLYENHLMLEICRNESQREQDYLAFKHICSTDNSVI